MTLMFNLGLAAYVVAFVLAILALVVKRLRLRLALDGTMAVAMVLQTVYMGLRWVEAGRPPFSNMFESLTLFGWTVTVIYLATMARMRQPVLTAAAALTAAVVLAYASTFEADVRPLVPALQSNWLTFHVFTCFLGYGGFAISFLASIAYLIVGRPSAEAKPELIEALDAVVTKTISFGFVFLTLGIITGAVWANSAWGTYWSWDPKETWSLITWFIYAIFLHCRYMRGWRGRKAAWISILGFLSVLFTYVGVNLFLSGLHSYA
jgi:cytochrome c-type biogenesis protein CcsB